MKIIITIYLIIISSFSFSQSKEQYKKVQDSLTKNEKIVELLEYANKEFIKYPKNEHTVRLLANAHFFKKDYVLSEQFYNKALDINPNCDGCYMNIAQIYSRKGNTQKTLEYLEKGIKTAPENAKNYQIRAQFKATNNDLYGALNDYNKAIKIDSTQSEYFTLRGDINSSIGYKSAALSDFTKAIKLKPPTYAPYFYRAQLYHSERQFEKALEDINMAIKLDDNQFFLYSARGVLYISILEFEKAIEDFTKAIEIDGTKYLLFQYRANAYYRLENMTDFCNDYLTLNSLINEGKITDPTIIKEVHSTTEDICNNVKASYYYQRGVGYYNLKKYNKAIDSYKNGLDKFPNNAMLLSFKGNAHMALNEYEKAIDSYYNCLENKNSLLTEIKINPRFSNSTDKEIATFYTNGIAAVYFSLSQCKAKLNDYDKALININKAIELNTDAIDLHTEYIDFREQIYLWQKK